MTDYGIGAGPTSNTYMTDPLSSSGIPSGIGATIGNLGSTVGQAYGGEITQTPHGNMARTMATSIPGSDPVSQGAQMGLSAAAGLYDVASYIYSPVESDIEHLQTYGSPDLYYNQQPGYDLGNYEQQLQDQYGQLSEGIDPKKTAMQARAIAGISGGPAAAELATHLAYRRAKKGQVQGMSDFAAEGRQAETRLESAKRVRQDQRKRFEEYEESQKYANQREKELSKNLANLYTLYG